MDMFHDMFTHLYHRKKIRSSLEASMVLNIDVTNNVVRGIMNDCPSAPIPMAKELLRGLVNNVP
jgi:hypothetical protein